MRLVDSVISLGSNCQTSFNIEKRFGTAKTFPFDWWNTPLFAVKRLLLTGFSELSLKKNLLVSKDRKTVIDVKYGVFLHHDFPRDPEMGSILDLTDEAILAVQEKYRRRGQRLQDILLSQASKLFVRFDSPGIDMWMKGYIGASWEDVTIEEMVQTIVEISAPNTCDFAIVDDDTCVSMKPVGEDRLRHYRLPYDPNYADWKGNIPAWQDALANYQLVSQSA